MNTNRLEEVKEIIAGVLGVKKDLITPEKELIELGADSSKITELAVELEIKFCITIPVDDEDDKGKFGTTNNIVNYIQQKEESR